MTEKELRKIKDEIIQELVPVIRRCVYIEIESERIREWLYTNLRDLYCITPALEGHRYMISIVTEMLAGVSREEAIRYTALKYGKNEDQVKRQLHVSIKVANNRIEELKNDGTGRYEALKIKKLPSQPELMKIIAEECKEQLRLKI